MTYRVICSAIYVEQSFTRGLEFDNYISSSTTKQPASGAQHFTNITFHILVHAKVTWCVDWELSTGGGFTRKKCVTKCPPTKTSLQAQTCVSAGQPQHGAWQTSLQYLAPPTASRTGHEHEEVSRVWTLVVSTW